MDSHAILYFIPIITILGAFTVAIISILSKMRMRELRIRERIAMIEKGLVPPPEVDPAGFDRAMGRYDRHGPYGRRGPGRHRRAGITIMGLGFGLMLLISMSADPRTGIGVGGFLVISGLAFLINGFFEAQHDQQTPPPPPPAPSATPPPQG